MKPKRKVGWGGARAGAGRKPKGEKAGMPHAKVPLHSKEWPVHVILRMAPDAPSPRSEEAFEEIKSAFAAVYDRDGFRLVHFSVQRDRLEVIVEASNRRILSNSLRALQISLARRLNLHFGRDGKLFPDRYAAKQLKTPREVRDALASVLLSAKKQPDPYSSARAFDGWRGSDPSLPPEELSIHKPKTSLLKEEWRKHGLISPREAPPAREA